VTFVHSIRVRYGEVDAQGAVFNAHWLAYFDDAMTLFFDHLGFPPKETFTGQGTFDSILVHAVIDWKGPAGFDDVIRIAVRPVRLGTSSFDLRHSAEVEGRPTCEATITYVSVKPGGLEPQPIPESVRAKLEAAMGGDSG
jgi:acyl-CoA thioester hydrolase